ncbi:hypothetical protein R70723_10125 [Paenibacillus sp. FSL R7-0273]|uniref:hypothetical protein n=1 Tax=Paenibacillus sp. FSL R7-0273 TaxID=1536772 RepID=UPI0004F75A91|nr:hypothetical protein [Paenibacillus sp. FSL R7-0273]AIQ46203.1 hypothetical protein R70723_10125 [Paenibacillus sp. FSL R7-0273]OMF84962.1 hypothetical protein BK144_28825 [Paenibacillus sp. FSL R7-0273]
MKTVTQFLLTLFAWILFTIGGFTFLRLETSHTVKARGPEQSTITQALYAGTGDLKKVSGAQLIGMIPQAIEGDYILVIDGIIFNEETDLDAVDLRGVPGGAYELRVTRNSEMITEISASR